MASTALQMGTSLIDLPKKSEEPDLLKIDNYTAALVEFIRGTQTPMTIGIQGDWGSGKTSLMNTLLHELCPEEKGDFHAVKVNTWEHSLTGSPEATIFSILQAVLIEVRELDPSPDTMEKLWSGTTKIFKTVLQVGAGAVGGDGAVSAVGESMKEEAPTISELRHLLQQVVWKVVAATKRQGIIFFIDDLDRLDPTVAVRVLEILKNLFDLNKCVFVLAIDYGVVVKGLSAKFGEMTEQNEWEFRAFFDKIIQLPFSMPVSSYDLSSYLVGLLEHISYFPKGSLDEEQKKILVRLAQLSIGSNPRSLKRVGNSISIVSLLSKKRDAKASEKLNNNERLIQFGLICCQIAYPRIYDLLRREPQFTKWNTRIAAQETRGQSLDSDELALPTDGPEFDEEWEQALYRICAPVEMLRRRVFEISDLLNALRELCSGEGEDSKSNDDKISPTLKNLLSNIDVVSVGGENSGRGRKSYDNFDELFEEWKRKEYKVEPAQTLYDFVMNDLEISQILGDAPRVNYSEYSLSFNTQTKKRGSVFVAVRPGKKQLVLTWPLPMSDESAKTKEYKGDLVRHEFKIKSSNELTEEVRQHIRECCKEVREP